MKAHWLFGVAMLAAGCASTPAPKPEDESSVIGTAGGGSVIENPTSTAATPPAAAAPAPATAQLHRRMLEAVLADSPGRFLQHVDVEPHFVGGRFAGWRLNALFPGDPRLDGVDLQAGDIVVSVNGLLLEQPDDLAKLWQALHGAGALDIAITRRGVPRRVLIPVIED